MKMSKPPTRARRRTPGRRPVTATTSSPPCVAVVDDHPDVCTVIASTLQSVGLRTISFTDPVAFVDAAAPAKFACIVLDMRMPRLSGFEVQQTLVARGVDTPDRFRQRPR